MTAKIEVKNLVKIFGPQSHKALTMLQNGMKKDEILAETGNTVGINNISFEVQPGEIFVVMGLSGSGKSTILRCLNRLIEPTAGSIIIDGQDITNLKIKDLRKVRQQKTAMVFQQFALLPHRNVLQNTVYGLEIQGVSKEKREKRALESLNMVGLSGYEKSYPDELSGGMKQRVGLARALTNDSDILLMDEAFSALDPLIREEMQVELLNLQNRMNKTIVFITHDLNEALKIGDRIAFVRDGILVQVGTPEEIISQPADNYVAKFVKSVDRTKILSVRDVMSKPQPQISLRDGPHVALRMMQEHMISSIFVVDRPGHLKGLITVEAAVEASQAGVETLQNMSLLNIPTIKEDMLIQQVLKTVLEEKYPVAVVDHDNIFVGILAKSAVLAVIAYKGGEIDVPTTIR